MALECLNKTIYKHDNNIDDEEENEEITYQREINSERMFENENKGTKHNTYSRLNGGMKKVLV